MGIHDDGITTVGQSYLGCCQNGLLSVFSLSGHSLFSQESVGNVAQIKHMYNAVRQRDSCHEKNLVNI